MSRNRHKHAHTVQVAAVVWWVLIFTFLGGTGLFYVCLKNQAHAFGEQRRICESKLNDLTDQNRSLAGQVRVLTSISKLQSKYTAGIIQMVNINQDGIVRLHSNSIAVTQLNRTSDALFTSVTSRK